MWVIIISLLYCLLIFYFSYVFQKKRKLYSFIPSLYARKKLSVIIPFRNEENNLPNLIDSLKKINTKNLDVEFIFIDDHSSDRSVEILDKTLHNFPYRAEILQLNIHEQGKRAALVQGIKRANYEIIVTLDADCQISLEWLRLLGDFHEIFHSRMIIGPVFLNTKKTFWSYFMSLEQLSLTASAAATTWAGKPILSSGANMLFFKYDFLNYVQFNAPNCPSGDDMFFLIYMKKNHRDSIHYIAHPQAYVYTKAPENIKSFINQRIRWVSKSKFIFDRDIIMVAFLVALTNISILLLIIMSIFNANLFKWTIAVWFFKSLSDYIFLKLAARHFKHEELLAIYCLAQLIYPIFVTFTSIYGNFGKYYWKHRKY